MPTVEISEDTYALLTKRAEQKDFDDTDEYVNYVLGQVADKVRRKQGDDSDFSSEDEEKVKERLRGLGYLD